MLTIRLARVGKKKQPTYRLIINERTKDTRGDFLEMLGNYNPRAKETNLKTDRIKYWLSKGAQTSATVHNLLVANKVIDAPKIKTWAPKKKEQKGEEKPAENQQKPQIEAKPETLAASQSAEPSSPTPTETPVSTDSNAETTANPTS